MSKTVRIGINGFGRIGRLVARAALERNDVDIVAVNDIGDLATSAHLFAYDSVHGRWGKPVSVENGAMETAGKKIRFFSVLDPAKIPWDEAGVDLVIEATGRFTKRSAAANHLRGGVRRVLISAPGEEADLTMVMGVNHTMYDPAKHQVISNASCTTNCLAPVAKVLQDKFGIERGLMTTIHSYTNDQRILDLEHKDLRRARAGAMSIIPTSTGAAKAIGLVIPEIAGRLNGTSVRVPTANVSLVDLVVELSRPADAEAVNAALKAAAEGELKGILDYCELPLVSRDFNGDPHSSIVDALSTMAIGGKMVKVVSWYDNEWAYSVRVVDAASYIASRGM
ncbi:MAG: type I glyceraldehyde-3-phosphate dehydrogenase [Solirubrobacterales bacterium]